MKLLKTNLDYSVNSKEMNFESEALTIGETGAIWGRSFAFCLTLKPYYFLILLELVQLTQTYPGSKIN